MPGRLKINTSVPSVALLERSPDRAIDFLRPVASQPALGLSDLVSSGDGSPEASEHSDLRERIKSTTWYHTIELPGGLTTPGFLDHRGLVPHYRLPDSLAGKRVLDIATFDGFWAFELERRGGDVTALDVPNSSQLDLPPPAREVVIREQLGQTMGTGFAIASQALGSRVRRLEGNVYDLNPAEYGVFDFVHLGALLLHLERPLDALRHVRSVTAGVLHFSDVFDPKLRGQTVRYLGGWSVATWWHPSLETLCQWVVDAGFSDVEVLATYRLNPTYSLHPTLREAAGPWEAIIRATP